MGGPSGLTYSVVPVVAFVVGNAVLGLTGGIGTAIGVAVVIAAIRLLRKEPVQPAVSGLLGVAVAAFVAYQTGSAKNFFLIGIWASLLLGTVFLVSILVRWPLAGVIWSLLNGHGHAWRRDKPSLRGYDLATLALVGVFAARFVVQQWLYDQDSTGWLAFARIAMGYPLLAVALLVVFWAVRRSGRRLAALQATA
ncbi:DUF3159 domain-containing protein [Nocardia sp. BMG51109]|uniref:DUF3159 domain-containing protein n=1 Tax=Nocardia sp. BMG51109 TaxID=1056816 RepID=UPI001E6039DF|nr:DUF3159 domain-containing protein [Nocardia sp. BMG51109]